MSGFNNVQNNKGYQNKHNNKFTKDSDRIVKENKDNLKLKANQVEGELQAVALDWKLFRSMEECSCSRTFDAFNRKVNIFQALLRKV